MITSNPSYSRTYGERYDGKLTVTDIAARMRADIKAAVDAERLPGAPVSYSVTIDRFAGGQAIDIRVRDWPGDPRTDQPYHPGGSVMAYTPEAKAAIDVLEAVHQAYNHDGSDITTDYFDVNYYGDVSFESAWMAQDRARKAARAAELRSQPKKARPDRQGLARHLRDVHRLGGTDRANFDLLSFWHRQAHDGRLVTARNPERHTGHDFESFGAQS